MSTSAADLISAWPVEHASAVALGADGSTQEYGDQDHVYRLASVTKPITAYAALIAIEEGVFTLDDPAGPERSTVRHLLAHASGLDMTSDKILAEPGRKRIYSNTGFQALAAKLSRRADIPFAEYVEQAVLQPLGMTATTIEGPSGAANDGAASSTRDLAAFAAELLAPTLLDVRTLADATSVQFEGLDGVLPGYGRQSPNDWGLGFEIRAQKSPHWTGSTNSPVTFGHFGQAGTFVWVDPVAGRACVALADRDFGEWSISAWPLFSDAVRRAELAR